jgi:hypothetical protein
MSKLILVLGATGAQDLVVVDNLLAPSEDGTTSPSCASRASRSSRIGHQVSARGTRLKGLHTGDTSDLASVAAALDGAYGAWINIDGFTVGEQRETYAGLPIFELAKQTKSLRHYIWSSLDYNLKVSSGAPWYFTLVFMAPERRGTTRSIGMNITTQRATLPNGSPSSHPWSATRTFPGRW